MSGLLVLPERALTDPQMVSHPTVYRVLSAFGKYADTTTGDCHPRCDRMASMLGMKRPAFANAVRLLKEWGYLQRVGKRRSGGGYAWRILLEPQSSRQEMNSEFTSGDELHRTLIERSDSKTSRLGPATPSRVSQEDYVRCGCESLSLSETAHADLSRAHRKKNRKSEVHAASGRIPGFAESAAELLAAGATVRLPPHRCKTGEWVESGCYRIEAECPHAVPMDEWDANTAADYFGHRMSVEYPGAWDRATDKAPLTGQISLMGYDWPVVKEMIDCFVAVYRPGRARTAWKSFVAGKEKWAAQAELELESVRLEKVEVESQRIFEEKQAWLAAHDPDPEPDGLDDEIYDAWFDRNFINGTLLRSDDRIDIATKWLPMLREEISAGTYWAEALQSVSARLGYRELLQVYAIRVTAILQAEGAIQFTNV